MGDFFAENDRFIGKPKRAAVVPRVVVPPSGEKLPLEYMVSRWLESGEPLVVSLYGPPGSGKSAALAHLRSVFADARLALFDGWGGIDKRIHDGVTIIASEIPHPLGMRVEMAPWGVDEAIEYLLATNRDACKSVMTRIKNSDNGDSLEGIAALWAPVLKRLAADESRPDIERALRRFIREVAGEPEIFGAAARACFRVMAAAKPGKLEEKPPQDWFRIARPRDESHPILIIVRYPPVAKLLAVDKLVELLDAEDAQVLTGKMLPHELIAKAGPRLSEKAIRFLNARIENEPQAQPVGVSLLLAADANWRPSSRIKNLQKVLAKGARWREVDFTASNLMEANLAGADLQRATLNRVMAHHIDLTAADLRGASMERFIGDEGSMAHADCSEIKADDAHLSGTNLKGANFEKAFLRHASFIHADLTNARFSHARLGSAVFRLAIVENADFQFADLTSSDWLQVDLRTANLRGAVVLGVQFQRCNLEGMDLSGLEFHGAQFTGAYLTNSIMHGGSMNQARLHNTGLAEIDWQNVDLRDADFTNASFHLGSTRSGLVNSVIASEGSRTGFYTDDYHDRDFKAPEEIRKASLRGCDLRGAKIDKTDFYLVDLRDAIYSEDQAEHFRRCGAILSHAARN